MLYYILKERTPHLKYPRNRDPIEGPEVTIVPSSFLDSRDTICVLFLYSLSIFWFSSEESFKSNRERGLEAREKRFQLVFCFLVQVMLSITITIIYTEYGGDEDERKPLLQSGLFLSIFHPRNQSRVYRPGMKVLERKIRSIRATSHLTPPNPWNNFVRAIICLLAFFVRLEVFI